MQRTELSFHPYVKLLGYLCLETSELPGDVVEIGVWKGKSLTFMRSLTSTPAKVIGVDPCALPGQSEELDYFHQQLFPSCNLIKKPSELAIQDVTNLSQSFKILHIDGGHAAENVFMDFLIYEHFVVPGGYVVFDDYGDHAYSPDVGPAVDDLREKGCFGNYEILGQPKWQALLDQAAIEADVSLHASAKYEQVGVDAGNGWQRQPNGGLWGSDWFGRAQAAVIYILVNDYHEAVYFIRGTDAKGSLLDSKHTYTMTFPKGALPPVDPDKGGFWSLTMYDKDYFMLPRPANGRTNIGTVNLNANELKFAADGSLAVTMSRDEPASAEAKANWLPAPEGQFALIVRAYVPTQPILDGGYKLPNVEKQ